jgi:hypothetical protein
LTLVRSARNKAAEGRKEDGGKEWATSHFLFPHLLLSAASQNLYIAHFPRGFGLALTIHFRDTTAPCRAFVGQVFNLSLGHGM